MTRRIDLRTHPCPKCGAAAGAPCISGSGSAVEYEHVARLRARHWLSGRPRDPATVLPRYDYPKRPRVVGVIVVTPAGVGVLARLVAGR